MTTPTRFERQEIKFLITERQQAALHKYMSLYMRPDAFGRSTVCSLYFDTPDFLLIRRSLEKPLYKEKLRLRSYGVPTRTSQVYAELKKKYKGIVYKRREAMSYRQAENWLLEGKCPEVTGQVVEEIRYAQEFYGGLMAQVFISAEREAFLAAPGGECPDLRLTLDQNILWRDWGLTLDQGVYGSSLLEPGMGLLEVKSGYGIPTWLRQFLGEQEIYRTNFSKYGNAYIEKSHQFPRGGEISA